MATREGTGRLLQAPLCYIMLAPLWKGGVTEFQQSVLIKGKICLSSTLPILLSNCMSTKAITLQVPILFESFEELAG